MNVKIEFLSPSVNINRSFNLTAEIKSATQAYCELVAEAADSMPEVIAASKKIEALLITDTASGSIASFPDGADGMPVKSLVVNIEPVQSGSGDPAPDNVRPITGWTGANVTAAGGNCINYSSNVEGSINDIGQEVTTTTFYRTAYIPATSDTGIISVASVGNDYNIRVHGYDASGVWLQQLKAVLTDGNHVFESFAIPSTVKQIRVSYPKVASGVELWQGKTKQISFPSTIYGGTDEVVSGSGKKTHAIITLTGDMLVNALSYERYIIPISDYTSPSAVTVDSIYSNMLKTEAKAFVYQNDFAISGNDEGSHSMIVRFDSSIDTLEKAKAYVNNNTIQVVYPVTTPSDFSTTPVTDLVSLYGQNNIFADCGPVDVEYRADVAKYIDKKLAAVVAALS